MSNQINKKIVAVPIFKGLHLKSAVSYLGNNILLLNTRRVDSSVFKNFQWIEVEEKNSYAANCLTIGNIVFMPAGFPMVRKKIFQQGFETVELDVSEVGRRAQ